MAKKEYKTTFDQLVTDLLSGKSFYDLIDWQRFVKKESTAFIVVDAMNSVLHKDGNLNVLGTWKVAEDMGLIQNIKNIVAACRKKEIPVFWVRQAYLEGGKDLLPGSYFEALYGYLCRNSFWEISSLRLCGAERGFEDWKAHLGGGSDL